MEAESLGGHQSAVGQGESVGRGVGVEAAERLLVGHTWTCLKSRRGGSLGPARSCTLPQSIPLAGNK